MYNPDQHYRSHLLHLDDLRGTAQSSRSDAPVSGRLHPLLRTLLGRFGLPRTARGIASARPAAADLNHDHGACMERLEERAAPSALERPPLRRDTRPTAPNVRVRRATPADHALVADLLARLPARTRYLRYLHPTPGSPEWSQVEAARMLRRPYEAGVTLIAVARLGEEAHAVGIGELAWASAASTRGELGVLVHDDQQGRGLGRALGRQLLVEALMRDLHELYAELLPENRAALRLLTSAGLPHTLVHSAGTLHITLQLGQLYPALGGGAEPMDGVQQRQYEHQGDLGA